VGGSSGFRRLLGGFLPLGSASAHQPSEGAVCAAEDDRFAPYAVAMETTPPADGRSMRERMLGAIGEGSVLRPPLDVDDGSNLRIGAGCFANFGLGGGAIVLSGVSIGENTVVGV
jgi:maltose O-acetyltransferase